MSDGKMRLAIWAAVIVAVPFALTAAVLLGAHLFGRHHETVTVNWVSCAATGLGLAGAWLRKQRSGGRRTP
jgi:hypothetical protein